ncbi:MAG: VOC family protein [Pseudomonadota bacterium]
MMRIEHANIVVTEIEPTLNFLTTAFPDWGVRGGGEADWYGTKRNWVHVGNDDSYFTLNDRGTGVQRHLQGNSAGLAHIAFEVDDLDGLVQRMTDAGFEPRVFGDEHPFRKNVYYIDPDGLEFEFVEYLSDDPAEKNMYD